MASKYSMNDRPSWPRRAIVTAGEPYGNKGLHFGHVGGVFVPADFFARFLRDRLGRENVIFTSGTDCYGSPIMESYRKLKENEGYDKSINEYVESNHSRQAATLNNYNISCDIYGGSGLGKTHLLTAIQTEIKRTHPDFVIMYVTCEQFTNELIAAIRAGSTEDFRMKYRVADLLLVDDIQFIAGKESTQEEFFHTFNSLHDAHKQIVIASDRPAKEIKSLEERLRTRFEWGLLADVQPPDLETRMLIVKRKADALNFDISDDVVEYIAQKLKNNIRQLESAVKKMQAYVQIQGAHVNTATAQQAIRDILSDNKPIPVVVDKIITEVARTYGANPEDLRSKKKDAQTSKYRQISMYIVREVTGLSAKAIGAEFGGRHYSTVLYALDEIKKESDTDSALRTTINDIIKNVQES